jgi:hypothetical protein
MAPLGAIKDDALLYGCVTHSVDLCTDLPPYLEVNASAMYGLTDTPTRYSMSLAEYSLYNLISSLSQFTDS